MRLHRQSLSHLSDALLLKSLHSLWARECESTAVILAHLAEVEERGLHLKAGYSTMYTYAMSELHLSEATAFRRVQAARAGRRHPVLLDAIADGRLHATVVMVLAPYLNDEKLSEWITAATHQTRRQIEQLLGQRYGTVQRQGVDSPTSRHTMISPPDGERPLGMAMVPDSPTRMGPQAPALVVPSESAEAGSGKVPDPNSIPASDMTAILEVTPGPTRPFPLARDASPMLVTSSMASLLREARELLGHAMPGASDAALVERASREMLERLRARKAAAAARPRRRAGNAKGRHVPAAIRRAVWERDGGCCTFVGENGHRCESRLRLEYDHATPIARGGEMAVENVRLRCRAHNQYEAERVFGLGFMRAKRREARGAASGAKARTRATASGVDGSRPAVEPLCPET